MTSRQRIQAGTIVLFLVVMVMSIFVLRGPLDPLVGLLSLLSAVILGIDLLRQRAAGSPTTAGDLGTREAIDRASTSSLPDTKTVTRRLVGVIPGLVLVPIAYVLLTGVIGMTGMMVVVLSILSGFIGVTLGLWWAFSR
jgi:hypothetical protein